VSSLNGPGRGTCASRWPPKYTSLDAAYAAEASRAMTRIQVLRDRGLVEPTRLIRAARVACATRTNPAPPTCTGSRCQIAPRSWLRQLTIHARLRRNGSGRLIFANLETHAKSVPPPEGPFRATSTPSSGSWRFGLEGDAGRPGCQSLGLFHDEPQKPLETLLRQDRYAVPRVPESSRVT
jgi:hypothetical protein